MSKRRKRNGAMIDMSARLNINVISTTSAETDILNKDLAEIEITVEKRMQLYEHEIRDMFISLVSESIITESEKDPSYFIEKYKDLIDRNNKNIINRMQLIQGYLQKLESEGNTQDTG